MQMHNNLSLTNEELTPSQHAERMKRILAKPVPRGSMFEDKLRSLLQLKERIYDEMEDGPTKQASERDIDAIRWALLPAGRRQWLRISTGER